MLTPAALSTPRPAMLPLGRTYVLNAMGCPSVIPSCGTGRKVSSLGLVSRSEKRASVRTLRLGRAGSNTASLICSAGRIHR